MLAFAAPALGSTIVSLEFDDATSDQLAGIRLATGHGMKVTVFAPSGLLGAPGFMTYTDLGRLQAQGSEIGGHTVDHLDLSQLSPDEQRHQICDDRAALGAYGLKVTDFAYPAGNWTAETRGILRACGYESARDDGGLRSAEGVCVGACPPVERIPPADRFQTRTIFPVLSTTSLATLESYVVRAERRGGGWVPLIFHHVCDGCDQYSIPAARLDRFLTWLATRSSMGTLVKTVRQVVNRPKKCKTDKTAPVTGNRAAALKHCKKIENWRRLLRHRVFRRSGGFEEARP